MIISHFVTDSTGKQDSPDNFQKMEEKKENKSQALIEVIEYGPLKITGNFIIKDLKRDIESAPGEALLCRCGKSATKPFCDESHKTK